MTADPQSIRAKAEALLRNEVPLETAMEDEDLASILHELRVHQIELELQNDELRRTQERLSQARERYFDLFNLAPVGYVLLNQQGMIMEINLRAAELLARNRSQLLQRPFFVHIAPDDRLSFIAHLNAVFQQQMRQEIDLALNKHSEAEPRYVHLQSIYTEDEDQPLCRIALTDISQRRQMEATLRRSEQKYRFIYDQSASVHLLLGLDGHILDANQTFLQTLGYHLDDVRGRSILDFVVLSDRKRADQALLTSSRQNHTETIEIKHLTRQGNQVNILYSSQFSPYYDGNTLLGRLLTGVDVTAQRRTQIALQNRELQLGLFVEHAPAALAMFDTGMRYLLASHRWREIYGLPGDNKFVGQRFNPLDPPHPQRWEAIFQRCLAGSTESREEDILYHADGRQDIIQWSIRPWRTPTGQIGGLIMATKVVTARTLMQRALEREMDFNRTLIQAAPVFYVATAPTGQILMMNDSLLGTLGYEADEITNQSYLETCVPPDERASVEALINTLQKTRHPQVHESQIRTRDGHHLLVEWHYCAVLDSEQKLDFVFQVGLDITQRRRQETQAKLTVQALEQQTDLLNSILDTIGDGVIVVDNSGNFLVFNPAAEQILGKGPTSLPPEAWAEVYGFFTPGDEDLIDPDNLITTRALQGTEVDQHEILVRNESHPNGTLISATARPMRDERDQIRAAVVVFRDINQQKTLERTLAEKVAQLHRSNAELEQFAYVASHDLQEPLRMIRSYVKRLEEAYKGELDERADKYIYYAVDGADRMRALIQDLLALSRLNTEAETWQVVDCQTLLTEVQQDLALQIQETAAEITSAELPAVYGDRSQLHQLFQNLLGNSLKFRSTAPPQIHIAARPHVKGWRFSVQDNGIGIAPEQHSRIFEIFKRLHGRTRYSGNGIGLAICKKIIDRHNGDIWVESTSGEGACFYFTLPAAAEE